MDFHRERERKVRSQDALAPLEWPVSVRKPSPKIPKRPNTPNGNYQKYAKMSKTQAGVHIVYFGAGGLFGCLFGDFAIPKHTFPQIDTAIKMTARKTKNPENIGVFEVFLL